MLKHCHQLVKKYQGKLEKTTVLEKKNRLLLINEPIMRRRI